MKKTLALALCVIMTLAMVSVAFAADDNLFAYDFSDDTEGDYIAIDKSINVIPKTGSITVAKLDGNMCLKIEHPDDGTSYDPYVNFFADGTDTWGCGTQFVVEYDVYFETSCDTMSWQLLCSRETPAAGTQFVQCGYIKGADLSVYIEGNTTDAVAKLDFKKWYTIAVAYDYSNDCFSIYLDGVCLAKDTDYVNVADTSATSASLLRTAFQGFQGVASAYLDNIVIYKGTEPRNVKVADTTAATTAATTTAAPATTTAAGTAAQTGSSTGSGSSTATADIAVVIAAVAAVAAAGAIVIKKKH